MANENIKNIGLAFNIEKNAYTLTINGDCGILFITDRLNVELKELSLGLRQHNFYIDKICGSTSFCFEEIQDAIKAFEYLQSLVIINKLTE